MPAPPVIARERQRDDSPMTNKINQLLLTRKKAAAYLHVSVSTIRRMEGHELAPIVGKDGVRYFALEQVQAVATRKSRTREPHPHQFPGVERSPGEVAAAVFERFEQRHSLAAIVTALRVQPSEVRALYHEWRISLERGEQDRRDAAPPQTTLTVPQRELARRLAALPTDGSVRLSLAREGRAAYSEGWDRIPIFDELTGFTVEQAVSPRQLRQQCGPGTLRITAYSLSEKRTLWEVVAEIS